MQTLKTIKKLLLTVACAAASLTAVGQDKMADVAPIDHKLRSIDSLAIIHLNKIEQTFATPGEDLYPTWDNVLTKNYGVADPVDFRIDLRGFHMPCDSRKVTSHYGYRPRFRRMHYGTDIKVYVGDTIYAAFSGKVRIVKYNRNGYGYYVVIRHPNGLETLYGHLSKQLVKENQTVTAGEPIGLGGNTGRSYGSHLHFEARILGKCLDPEKLFCFENSDVISDTYIYNPHGTMVATGNTAPSVGTPAAKASGDASVHRVRKGESLYIIARKHGTTVDKLCSLNNIKQNATLREGQLLRCN